MPSLRRDLPPCTGKRPPGRRGTLGVACLCPRCGIVRSVVLRRVGPAFRGVGSRLTQGYAEGA